MEIRTEGVVVIVGSFGSGKTEIAINLAVSRKAAGTPVRIADLDLVNPYFRTRDARAELAAMGVETVLPPEAYLHADLPILAPTVAGMLKRPGGLTLLDVGGNDVGATVLAALGDVFAEVPFRMFQVVNPFRPLTQTLEGCRRIRAEIEAASRLEIDGVVCNPNLMDETLPSHVLDGYAVCREFAASAGLPVEMVAVPEGLVPEVAPSLDDCPVLPIRRRLVPPWQRSGRPAVSKGAP